MKIDITGPMVGAHVEGLDTYTPVVDGQELKLEHGDTDTTLANLSQVVTPKREVAAVYQRKRQVLFVFSTGETYLATGLWAGSNEVETKRLADFVAAQKIGGKCYSAAELFGWYRNLSLDYEGPLTFPATDFASEDSGVIGSGDTQHSLRIH